MSADSISPRTTLPRLASSGGDRWLVRTMRPGAEPMHSLATALNSLPPNSAAANSSAPRVLLVVDRIERLGTWNGRDRVDVLLLKGGGWMLPAQLAQVSDPAAATYLDQQTGFRCAAAAD
jgi:hypothetical protein